MSTFEYTFELRKADSDDGRLLIEGCASTTDIDLQKDQMTVNALHSMAKAAEGVPIVTSHNAEAKDMIGAVTSAAVDGSQLIIKAELDPDDSEARRLYSKLCKGYKLGLSVGGRASVQRGIGKSMITDVNLDHIMLTRKPCNAKTFAFALNKALAETITPEIVAEFKKNYDATAQLDQSTRANSAELEDQNTMTTEDLEKAGARLSADSMDALHAIHKNSNDGAAVRSAVEGLMGDAFDPAKGFADGSGSPDNAEAEVAGGASSEDPIGVVNDGIAAQNDIKKALAETIKAELKAYADEIAKSIREELAPTIVPQVKDESEYTAARSFVNDIAAAMRL